MQTGHRHSLRCPIQIGGCSGEATVGPLATALPLRVEFPVCQAYLVGALTAQGCGPMATTNPIQFLQQVRAEIAKVSWPSRREVMLTSVMVFIMAALTATFFSLVDLGIRTGLAGIFDAF